MAAPFNWNKLRTSIFSWTQNSTNWVADPLKDVRILDIEALGLKPGLPIVEAALHDPSSKKSKVWTLQPSYKGKFLTKQETLALAEPWFLERAETKFADIWAKPKTDPSKFVGELAQEIKGKTVLIANAPYECLSGDTLIQCVDGSIIELKDWNKERFFGTKSKAQLSRSVCEVEGFDLINKGYKSSYEIRTWHGIPTVASAGHMWFTQRGWIRTDQLTTDDWLLSSVKEFNLPENNKYSDDELSLIGWWIAEGCRKKPNVTVAEDYFQFLPNPYSSDHCWRSYGINRWYINPNGKKTGQNKFNSLLRDLNLFDKYSYQKFIPNEILKCSNRQLALVINSMFCGDGSVSKEGLLYTTTSKKLAHQLMMIYQRFDIVSYLYEYDDNRKDSYKRVYRVIVSTQEMPKFLDKIGLSGRKLVEAKDLIKKSEAYLQYRAVRRVPIDVVRDWKLIWKSFAKTNFGKKRKGKFPYKKLLSEFTGLNTDGMYNGNAKSWDQEAFNKLCNIFNIDPLDGLIWTQIKNIEPVGDVEVWDISVDTYEFLANGLVVHNSRMLAELFKHHLSAEELTNLRSQFETRPLSEKHTANLFFVTGTEVQSARSAAFKTRDWLPVLKAYNEAFMRGTGGATSVRDIQDVTRAMYSLSQRIGVVRDIDSFVGSSMNVLSLAYTGTQEAHRAAKDTVLEASIFGKTWKTATSLASAEEKGIPGLLGFLFSSHTRDDLTALKRLDSVRGFLKEKSVERSLAEARWNIEFLKNKDYYVADSHREWLAPMETFEGRSTKTVIGIPNKTYPGSFDEAARMLTSPRFIGRGMSIDVARMVNEVKGLSETELKSRIHLPERAAAEVDKKLLSMMDKAGKWTTFDSLRFLATKHPIMAAGSVLTGLYLAGGALNIATSRTNVENIRPDTQINWSGLEDYGLRASMRHENTDFGSGWEGILYSLLNVNTASSYDAKLERWKRTVWQIPGRRAAMEADLKEREKRYRENLGALETQDAVTVRNRNLLEGINVTARKNMLAMTISPNDFIFNFDDADTLMLRKKGLFGMGVGKPMSIRLAGIDAPEVGGHTDDPLSPVRIGEGQPYGRRASTIFKDLIERQGELTLVFDPKAKTYGRTIGMLFGDQGLNINLAMVRAGAAASLPFGESGTEIVDRNLFQAAETGAIQATKGMWADPFWQAYKSTTSVYGESITFNTLTMMTRLAKDPNLARLMIDAWRVQERGYFTESDAMDFGAIGIDLRSRKRPRGSRRRSFRGTSEYNLISGMQHRGTAASLRADTTEFGSGWRGLGLGLGLAMAIAAAGTSAEMQKKQELWQPITSQNISSVKYLKPGINDAVILSADLASVINPNLVSAFSSIRRFDELTGTRTWLVDPATTDMATVLNDVVKSGRKNVYTVIHGFAAGGKPALGYFSFGQGPHGGGYKGGHIVSAGFIANQLPADFRLNLVACNAAFNTATVKGLTKERIQSLAPSGMITKPGFTEAATGFGAPVWSKPYNTAEFTFKLETEIGEMIVPDFWVRSKLKQLNLVEVRDPLNVVGPVGYSDISGYKPKDQLTMQELDKYRKNIASQLMYISKRDQVTTRVIGQKMSLDKITKGLKLGFEGFTHTGPWRWLSLVSLAGVPLSMGMSRVLSRIAKGRKELLSNTRASYEQLVSMINGAGNYLSDGTGRIFKSSSDLFSSSALTAKEIYGNVRLTSTLASRKLFAEARNVQDRVGKGLGSTMGSAWKSTRSLYRWANRVSVTAGNYLLNGLDSFIGNTRHMSNRFIDFTRSTMRDVRRQVGASRAGWGLLNSVAMGRVNIPATLAKRELVSASQSTLSALNVKSWMFNRRYDTHAQNVINDHLRSLIELRSSSFGRDRAKSFLPSMNIAFESEEAWRASYDINLPYGLGEETYNRAYRAQVSREYMFSMGGLKLTKNDLNALSNYEAKRTQGRKLSVIKSRLDNIDREVRLLEERLAVSRGAINQLNISTSNIPAPTMGAVSPTSANLVPESATNRAISLAEQSSTEVVNPAVKDAKKLATGLVKKGVSWKTVSIGLGAVGAVALGAALLSRNDPKELTRELGTPAPTQNIDPVYSLYANTQGDNIMNQIYRGDPSPGPLMTISDSFVAGSSTRSKPNLPRLTARDTLTRTTIKRAIRNNFRSHHQANLQDNAMRDIFTSPINHSVGGA